MCTYVLFHDQHRRYHYLMDLMSPDPNAIAAETDVIIAILKKCEMSMKQVAHNIMVALY